MIWIHFLTYVKIILTALYIVNGQLVPIYTSHGLEETKLITKLEAVQMLHRNSGSKSRIILTIKGDHDIFELSSSKPSFYFHESNGVSFHDILNAAIYKQSEIIPQRIQTISYPNIGIHLLGISTTFPHTLPHLRPMKEYEDLGDLLSSLGSGTNSFSMLSIYLHGDNTQNHKCKEMLLKVMKEKSMGNINSDIHIIHIPSKNLLEKRQIDFDPIKEEEEEIKNFINKINPTNQIPLINRTINPLIPLRNCYSTLTDCIEKTSSCSNHGSCTMVPQGCFTCLCTPTRQNSKTYNWSGSICQKMDISADFVLLVTTGIVMLFILILSLRMLISLGYNEGGTGGMITGVKVKTE